jgi:hypothetical protein
MAHGHRLALTPYGSTISRGILRFDSRHHQLLMTFINSAQNIARYTGKDLRSHLLPILLVGAFAAAALAFVAYLLWPTWEIDTANGPARLPVSIG